MSDQKPYLIKVKTQDLKPGMFVVDIGRGWLRHPWKSKRKLITSQHEINQLIQHNIKEVTVDLALSKKIAFPGEDEFGISGLTFQEAEGLTPEHVSEEIAVPEVHVESPETIADVERRKKPRPEKPRDDASQDAELPKARQAYSRALDVTREFTADVRAGRPINMEKVQESLEDMIDSVFRNRNSLVALMKLRNYDEYTFTHSLNVAALALSVGRSVNFNRDQLFHLGLGAIFHDLGKTHVPDSILNKPGRLTDNEFEIMKQHPEMGEKILLSRNMDLPPSVMQIVRHHHERVDGSGYPDGIEAERIEPFVTICGISDVYDALSSERVYKKAMLPHEALKVVFSLRGAHFPMAWVDRFIQVIGIYPVGTTVLLNTDEVGVVCEVNSASLVRPKLMMVLDRKKRHFQGERYLDLNQPDNEAVDVIGVVDPKSLNIDPAGYFPV